LEIKKEFQEKIKELNDNYFTSKGSEIKGDLKEIILDLP